MVPHGYTARAMTNASRHRLAAILAADFVGYSRLISADEAGTLAAMRTLRAELWDTTTETFGGCLVGTAGDSRLVEFPSAVAAVECAAVIQRAMLERNADVPEDRRIRLRIGVNLGEVSSTARISTATASTSPPGSKVRPRPMVSASPTT